MASGFQKYGLTWTCDKLGIELRCIRRGGELKKKDGTVTKIPLFDLYKEAMTLLWPEDDWHRWADLCLKEILENDITILMGAGDSNKTYIMSKYALVDWWAFPNDTLWMLSSTEYRGAELRIWGCIKRLFNRAMDRWEESLCGSVLESMHAITTEQISDDRSRARSLQRGLIFVPCKKGGSYVGLSAFVGAKAPRLRHAGDECFPAGTLVDTPLGRRLIETIKTGDKVFGATGIHTVQAVMERECSRLVRITAKDGRTIVCTPDHPILTNLGWKKAIDLGVSHYMLTAYEAMSILRQDVQSSSVSAVMRRVPETECLCGMRKGFQTSQNWMSTEVLRKVLQDEMVVQTAGFQGEILYKGKRRQNRYGQKGLVLKAPRGMRKNSTEDDFKKSNDVGAASKQTIGSIACDWMEADYSWRQRNWTNQGRKGIAGNVSRGALELPYKNREMEWKRIPTCIQGRHCVPANQTCCGSRWSNTQITKKQGKRRKKDRLLAGSWVDRVEVLERNDSDFRPNRSGKYRVYNLQVAEHPSYSVNGFVVHNCQFLDRAFLDAYTNWYGKKNFKGIMAGNPVDTLDSLCYAAEPDGGWENWNDTEKTQVWTSKFYGARVVALDGRDSPNMDFPQDQPARYDYLVGRKKLDATAKTYGKDSWQYWSQCIGKPNTNMMVKRVLTRQLCEEHGAFDKAVWMGTNRVKVYGVDPNYGGEDRCVGTLIEFGEGINGHPIMKFYAPEIIPVSVKKGSVTAEMQIANWVSKRLEDLGVPSENCFYDSTGKGTIGAAFAQVYGDEPNPVPVDSGGVPTERPVRHDYFIDDEGTRRLKTCREEYSKFVTEMWFSVREIVEGDQAREFSQEALFEFSVRKYEIVKAYKTEIEPKEKLKERLGYSCDLADSTAIAVEGARRRGFQILRLGTDITKPKEPDYLEEEEQKYADILNSKLLTHA